MHDAWAAFCYTTYMSWAAERRLFILTLIGIIAVAILGTIGISIFYKEPSCSDGVQNQGESGVDCGGPCEYLCTDQQHAPTVLFTKAFQNGPGRTDVVASIENVNASSAAKRVPYTITLYGTGQVFVQQMTGVIDLPPASTVPVFVPNISSGNQQTIHAFLTIDPSAVQWFHAVVGSVVAPVVTNTTLSGTADSPRIDATISNAGTTALVNTYVDVIVSDANGEVIAASQTIVPTIPGQGVSTATFTWNSAFPSVPAKIEVVPVMLLP